MSAQSRDPSPPSFASATARVFELSLGGMLRSRRTTFLGLVVAGPILLAFVARLLEAGGISALRVNGVDVGGSAVFGMMIWMFFLRFIVPVLGVFYGTALIADEIEDRTITYLFARPIDRGAVLTGKFFAYLVCAWLVVLPAVIVVFFLLVPFPAIGGSFGALMKDLGILAMGLAAYGALFSFVGAVLKRPLVIGLVFVLGWEPLALLLPGYLKRFTLAYYLQGLVPHAMPAETPSALLQVAFRDVPPPATAVFWLSVAVIGFLGLAIRVVGRREYVLEQ